jgi:hypothetical protein
VDEGLLGYRRPETASKRLRKVGDSRAQRGGHGVGRPRLSGLRRNTAMNVALLTNGSLSKAILT